MIVTCQPLFPGDDRPVCGKIYDDAKCSTLCPHDPLPPKLTQEEQNAILEKMAQDGFFDRPRAEGGDD